MKKYIIVAADEKNGIGKNGLLPWKLKKDMEFFQQMTLKTEDNKKKNAVIMGSNTWISIPEKHRPLKDRLNIVLSKNRDFKAEKAEVAFSLDDSLKIAEMRKDVENVFFIGGANIYKQVLENIELTGIYLTRVRGDFKCDAFFPEIPKEYKFKNSLGKENDGRIEYEFLFYE